MRRVLNTLYVTTQGAYLRRDGETVVVTAEEKNLLRVPIHTLSGIVCFGRVGASPALMGLCGERQVTLSFLSMNGRFLARVDGPVSGNVLLRRAQYRMADDEDQCSLLAWSFLGAKIANSRVVLLRANRDHPENQGYREIELVARRLGRILQDLDPTTPLDSLRGFEGDAARAYFSVFDHLITNQKDAFSFQERNRRPPLDNVNAMLSFVYTLITHDTTSALEAVGLDPAVGFLHSDRPGRPSLALDLMEEMRALIADRLVLSLINRQQVNPSGFVVSESGAVMMDEKTRKTVITAYQSRKEDELKHPFLGERIRLGLLPHVQAMLLARYLRGDLDMYPAFLWR